MQQFRRILVGVDVAAGERLATEELGPATVEAVRRAVWLGEQLRAEVTFLAALDLSADTEEELQSEDGDASPVAQAARRVLEKLVADARARQVMAHAVVKVGTPWLELTRQALRGQHDLLVVGTRDRGAVSRFFFGSTSMKLLRTCPCPVWVTRPDPKFDDLNLLVACSLGDDTERLLHIAVGGGRLLDAKVHLIHALEPTPDATPSKVVADDDDADADAGRSAREVEAERLLRTLLGHTDFRTLRHGVKIHLVEGDPDPVILDAIPRYGIDLLVLGTKARTGIPGVVIGNTAERLLAAVDCSVFVVKPADFVCPVTLES